MRYLLIGAVDLPGMRACVRFNGGAHSLLVGRLGAAASLGSSLGHVFRLLIECAMLRLAYANQLTLTIRQRNDQKKRWNSP